MKSSADSLTAKMDALAEALSAAGVDVDATARVLGAAAEATMHALVLDAVLDELAAEAVAAEAVAEDEAPVELAA